MHLFCFGLGYVSSAIAKELSPQWKVSGSHTGKRKLTSSEYIFNEQVKFDPKALEEVTHILISIPPNAEGDPVFLSFIQDIKQLKNLKWIGYFSSTSVYGDHQGAWVDETSKTDALDPLGKNRLIAEEQWLGSGLPVNIFRLSGIYGPGRSVIETIRAGKAMRIFKENHCFSRIHVRDIVRIICLAMDNPILGEIYNIADDFPSPQHEVVSFGCKLLNVAPPEMVNFAEANLAEGFKHYYASSKKVSNSKVKNIYGLKLIYPSYKEGLISCIFVFYSCTKIFRFFFNFCRNTTTRSWRRR